jgi:hypothetical protein
VRRPLAPFRGPIRPTGPAHFRYTDVQRATHISNYEDQAARSGLAETRAKVAASRTCALLCSVAERIASPMVVVRTDLGGMTIVSRRADRGRTGAPSVAKPEASSAPLEMSEAIVPTAPAWALVIAETGSRGERRGCWLCRCGRSPPPALARASQSPRRHQSAAAGTPRRRAPIWPHAGSAVATHRGDVPGAVGGVTESC